MENERELEDFGKIAWARDADGTIHGKMPCEAIRERTGKYAIDDENHRMWFRASNPGLQDDGLDIPTSAWKKDIKSWLKRNPVFMPFHDYSQWSLGHGVDAEITEEALRIQVEFGYGRNPEATMAWEIYKHRDQNAVSVGFRILESEDAEYGEGENVKHGRLVKRAKLLELSAVPLPMDEEALAERMARYAAGDPVVARACRSFACAHCQERLHERPGWDEPEGGHMIHYRIRPPEDFTGKFVTLSMDVKGTADVQVVRGKLADGDDKMHAQSIRFDKDKGWDMAEAKSWWESHKESLMKQADEEVEQHEAALDTDAILGKILELVTEIRLAQASRAPVLTTVAPGSATEIPKYVQQIDSLAAAVMLDDEQVARRLEALANRD